MRLQRGRVWELKRGREWFYESCKNPSRPLFGSGNDRTGAVHRLLVAHHECGGIVGFLADVLEQLGPRFPAQIEIALPRRGVGAGVVNGHLVLDRVRIGAREAFEGPESLCVGVSAPVDPEALVETRGVDDQRVAFPPADGVAVETGLEILRMRPTVRVDGPVRVGSPDVEDVDALDLR